VKLVLGKDFPHTPPKAYFLTKIFHPNVASSGEICVNTLKKDWKPDLGIKHILLVSKTFDNILIKYYYIHLFCRQ
jgi:ubiquitin-conjugating enzyme E2 S